MLIIDRILSDDVSFRCVYFFIFFCREDVSGVNPIIVIVVLFTRCEPSHRVDGVE